MVKNLLANAGDIRDTMFNLWVEHPSSLEEGMTTHSSILAWSGNTLPGYCLGIATPKATPLPGSENPFDRGVWWALVHRVAKSPT